MSAHRKYTFQILIFVKIADRHFLTSDRLMKS